MLVNIRRTYPLGGVAALLLLLLGSAAFAEGVDPAIDKAIRTQLGAAMPNLKIASITASPAGELYEVDLGGGQYAYATADGNYFVVGNLYQANPEGLLNITEANRDSDRQKLIAAVREEEFIVFSPQGPRKAVVSVFTDVDCFYCQKLHREVPAMNELGIEVRYLAYPRAGVGSDSYRKIASAWCADDRRDAITRLKNREEIPDNVCPGNPVAEHFLLGQEIGVRGTPALVLESGQMIPGFVSAAELATTLGIN